MPFKPAYRVLLIVLATVLAASASAQAQTKDANALYMEHCAACHDAGRLGAMGPALLPGNLGRLKKKAAANVIANGAPATQMPAYGKTLNADEINALVELIYTPLAELPTWGEADIIASRVEHTPVSELVTAPVHKADPMNLFTVVEIGDHHVTILDGDKFESIWRFQSRFALHGGAKYSPDGRFVYFGSRDGWVSKYDLWGLVPVVEARAGINLRNIAVSADGRYVMAANYLPHTLVLLDANDLSPIKIFEAGDAKGNTSRVSAVYTAPPRKSFVVALKDVPEMWEISYADNPRPAVLGRPHNFQKDQMEGAFDFGPFPLQRIKLEDYLDDFFFNQSYSTVIGAARNVKQGQVVNLNARRRIATFPLDGMPHLGSGIIFDFEGRPVLATPHLSEGVVSVIDMETWQVIRRIETMGPGFFMRSHDNTPYAWVDVFFGPNKDVLHVIDKRTLEIVKTLKPAPGKTAGHVEFDKDGRYVLVSIWENDGALVIYDAKTLEEVKRLPMNKPSGKYNVYNKINYARGTSH